jgi:hypothetical protein
MSVYFLCVGSLYIMANLFDAGAKVLSHVLTNKKFRQLSSCRLIDLTRCRLLHIFTQFYISEHVSGCFERNTMALVSFARLLYKCDFFVLHE